jgi:hypothetical protein
MAAKGFQAETIVKHYFREADLKKAYYLANSFRLLPGYAQSIGPI